MQVEECPHSPCRGHPICPECRGDVTLSEQDSPMSQEGEVASGTDSDDKESSGSSPFPPVTKWAEQLNEESSQVEWSGPKGRKRRERTQATNTIKSSWASTRRNLAPRLLACLEEDVMPSSADPPMLKRMSIKKRPGVVSLLSTGLNRFEETQVSQLINISG